jgi:acetyltransferase EpsM
MSSLEKLIIVGAGGLGSEVASVVKRVTSDAPRFELLGYCDDSAEKRGQKIEGFPVLGTAEQIDRELDSKPSFVCAIGNNRIRLEVVKRLLGLGWKGATIVDPSVYCAETVKIGPGSYVAPKSTLSPYVEIGSHVIVNFGASITHNVKLENYSQVAPGAGVMGFGTLKEGAFVAANGAVMPGVTIGAWATLGACSFAMHDVPDGATAVGVPARVVFRSGAKK